MEAPVFAGAQLRTDEEWQESFSKCQFAKVIRSLGIGKERISMHGELLDEVYLYASAKEYGVYGAFKIHSIEPFSGVWIERPDGRRDHYGCDAGFWSLYQFREISAADFAAH